MHISQVALDSLLEKPVTIRALSLSSLLQVTGEGIRDATYSVDLVVTKIQGTSERSRADASSAKANVMLINAASVNTIFFIMLPFL